MLAYVYGVVPISLCRSGGCGVSAGNGKGVRIEFDDENDINVGGTNTAVGKSFKQRKRMYLLIVLVGRIGNMQIRISIALLSLGLIAFILKYISEMNCLGKVNG